MAPQKRVESHLRLNARDFRYSCLLVGVVALVFWDVLFLQKAFLSGDHLIQHYPWAKFLQDSIHHFRLPWWTSQIQCGFPLLAEGQVGAFYPPNLIFLFFLPLREAYNYEALFHFVIGALFFYLYVRRLGFAPAAAFFSSLIFLLGSTEGGFFYNITSQRVSVWFPLSLFFVERLIDKATFRDGALLGIVFALQIFAGYQQIAVYTIAFTTLYFFLRLIPFFRSGRFLEGLRPLSVYGYAAFLGLAISAVQWFPFLQLSAFSSRAQATEPLAYLGSPFPFFPMTLLFPDWTGLWRGGIYVGILGLFFVLWSLFTKKEGVEKIWFFIFVFAMLLGFGKWSPLYRFIVKAFKIYFFRVPTKFLFFASFALAVLAGSGFNKFLHTGPVAGVVKKSSVTLFGFFMTIVTAMALGHWICHFYRAPLLRFLENYLAVHFYGQPYHPHSLEVYREKLLFYYDHFLYLTSLLAPETRLPALLFLAQTAVCGILFTKKRVRWGVPLLLTALFADLFIYVQGNTRRDLVSFQAVQTQSQGVNQVGEDPDTFRIHEFNTEPLRSGLFPLVPNQNMLFRLEDAGIYSPLAFLEYKNFLGDLGGVDDSLYQNKASIEALRERRDILDRLNVKYIFSNVPLKIDGLIERGKEDGVWLYRNQKFWPRAFFTKTIERAPHFDSIQKVEILSKEEGRRVFNTRDFGKGYLVVSEQNYPGWRFREGGRRGTPISLGVGLKAIPLSGEGAVTELFFKQEHKRVLWGVLTGGLLLALLGLKKSSNIS